MLTEGRLTRKCITKNEGKKVKRPFGGRAGDRPCLGSHTPVNTVQECGPRNRSGMGLWDDDIEPLQETRVGLLWGTRHPVVGDNVQTQLWGSDFSSLRARRFPQSLSIDVEPARNKGQPWSSHPLPVIFFNPEVTSEKQEGKMTSIPC